MAKQRTLPQLKKQLWNLFAEYIKLRASSDGEYCRCFTCGKSLKIGTQGCNAGHYLPKGAYPGLYFHEMNVHPQCYSCNGPKQGNQIVFRENLISKYSEDMVMALESARHEPSGWVRTDYMEKIEHYKEKIRTLKLQF